MTRNARIELRDLHIAVVIGPDDADSASPETHVLDLTLSIAPELVQIPEDDMTHVFDYDPLVAQIDQLTRGQHYATQEYLMSRIVAACAQFPEIVGLDVCLRKWPLRDGSGSLGVRLTLGKSEMEALRAG